MPGQLNKTLPPPTLAGSGLQLRSSSILNRVFTRHLMNMAILMMVPLLLAPTLNLARTFLVDPDIWWHLADARFLLTTHHFIQTDPYSFTVVGQRWVNWEWLGELPYWFSYQALRAHGGFTCSPGWRSSANVLFVYWRGFWTSRMQVLRSGRRASDSS